VVRSVYVQTNWPPGREVEEVGWAQSVADRHGFPHAIVGYADLAAASLEPTLDQMMKHARLRGIRQQLHWHDTRRYRFAARADLMDDPAWRRGLGEVARRGLLFELQVFAGQMEAGARLVRDFPQATFVLLHAGMLEDTSPDGWARWRAGLRGLAAAPNVCVKLSGLGTFARLLGGPLAPGDPGDRRAVRSGALHVREQLPDREAVDDLRRGGARHHRVPGRALGGRAARGPPRHRRPRVSTRIVNFDLRRR
jgi:hypothetical protein